MDEDDRSREQQQRMLWALRTASNSVKIQKVSKLLQAEHCTDAVIRAQALVMRSDARLQMGLRASAQADALQAQRLQCGDVETCLQLVKALRQVQLITQAREVLREIKTLTTHNTASTSSTTHWAKEAANIEAALATSCLNKLPQSALVRIFAAVDDVSSLARCRRVCKRWYAILQARRDLWTEVRRWTPFRLPTLSYYIDDAESIFPPPRQAFANTVGILMHCARASGNRLQHVSVDLRGLHSHQADGDEGVLIKTWATLRRSAPSLRSLHLCFTHTDPGARSHLSALLRAAIRLEHLTLYYAPRPRTEVDQAYDPLAVDLRPDPSTLASTPLQTAHLFLPECSIVFDEQLIQRFAHLQELTLVRGVFEPLDVGWLCALFKQTRPTLRRLHLGCAMDDKGGPTPQQLDFPQFELPLLEEYRSDTTEYDPMVRRLQAVVGLPSLKVLDLCNLDPEAVLLHGDAQESDMDQEATGSDPVLYQHQQLAPASPSTAASMVSTRAAGPSRGRKRRVPSLSPSPPRLLQGILNVGGELARLEVLILRTVSLEENAAIIEFLQQLTTRTLATWSRSRTDELDEHTKEVIPDAAGSALEAHRLGRRQEEVPMLLPCLRSLTIQDHATLPAAVIVDLVNARRKHLEDEEAAFSVLLHSASLAGGLRSPDHQASQGASTSRQLYTQVRTRPTTVSGMVRTAPGESDGHAPGGGRSQVTAEAMPMAAAIDDNTSRPSTRMIGKESRAHLTAMQVDEDEDPVIPQASGAAVDAAAGAPVFQLGDLDAPRAAQGDEAAATRAALEQGLDTETYLPTESVPSTPPRMSTPAVADLALLDPHLLAQLTLSSGMPSPTFTSGANSPTAGASIGEVQQMTFAMSSAFPGAAMGGPTTSIPAASSTTPSTAAATTTTVGAAAAAPPPTLRPDARTTPILPTLPTHITFRPLEVVRLLNCAALLESEEAEAQLRAAMRGKVRVFKLR